MVRLAESEENVPIPCSQLARGGKLPERFLLQVLRALVIHGLLHSSRGVDGGYYLARPASEITLCEIIEAFDNPLEPKLPEINGASPLTVERVLWTLRQASEAARAELDRLTVADLVRKGSERRPLEQASR
jgi:Rrf2 family protein